MRIISFLSIVLCTYTLCTTASTPSNSIYLCSDDPTVKSGPALTDCTLCSRTLSKSSIKLPSPEIVHKRTLHGRTRDRLIYCAMPSVTTYLVVHVPQLVPFDESFAILTLLDHAADILTGLLLHPRGPQDLATGWMLPWTQGTKLTLNNYNSNFPITCVVALDAVRMLHDFMSQTGIGTAIAHVYAANAEVAEMLLTINNGF